jgi:hypothetical protein
MRSIFIGSSAFAALLTIASHGAVAQQNAPFCLRSEDGNTNCAYQTMAQCEEAKKGASNTGTCVARPAGGEGGMKK